MRKTVFGVSDKVLHNSRFGLYWFAHDAAQIINFGCSFKKGFVTRESVFGVSDQVLHKLQIWFICNSGTLCQHVHAV